LDSGIATAAPVSPKDEDRPVSDLVIHEWGTFLGMSGSDGTSLDGMYHEEHALPSFVHARSRDQLTLPSVVLKGETPVIYFYTPVPRSVRLGVSFPRGIWTQWYPQAARVWPSLVEQAQSPDRLGGGRICWYADLIPPGQAESPLAGHIGEAPSLSLASAGALWNFARDVDAAYVKCLNNAREPAVPEFERFLFYRGLGLAPLPLRLDVKDGGSLTLDRDPMIGDGVRHVFVLRIEKGRAAYRYLPALRPGQTVARVLPTLADAQPLARFTEKIAGDLASRLEASGLFAKEARAMVNTWTTSYFQTEGVRVLFVLPQSWTDAFIPMDVNPRPKELIRVMVGRLELLSQEREERAEAAIRNLAAPEATRREEAFAYLSGQGRYVEPIVRRVLRTTRDENVRQLCRRLLHTEFVTELRAAVHDAIDGTRLAIDPLMLRAHLARLLREIGLDRQGRAEGLAILRALDHSNPLPQRFPEAVSDRREIRAAALEATGVDRSVAAAYEECIRALLAGPARGTLNSGHISFCRQWWVGRAYGRSVVRAGNAEQVTRQLEASLALGGTNGNPCELRQNRLLLAYVHEARGNQEKADRVWSTLSPESESRATSAIGSGLTDQTAAR
jgi:hypothetical protein